MIFVCGGATCSRNRGTLADFTPPVVFRQGVPSLAEVIEQTNRSMAVQSLSSSTLTITGPEIPYKLQGTFRWERPYNMLLETKLVSAAMGVPLAAGSNAQMFWLQIQRPSPTLYFASHDQFENQKGPKHVLPVSPLWIREAFGIIELDPSGRHEGPTTTPTGNLTVTSYIPSPRGEYRRIIVMKPDTATLTETYLYNENGKLIAHSTMSNHQHYSVLRWSLPHKVQIQLYPDLGDPIAFNVEVGFYSLNEPSGAARTFEMPETRGLSTVDLVRANGAMQQSSGWVNPHAAGMNSAGMNSAGMNSAGSSSAGTSTPGNSLNQQTPLGSEYLPQGYSPQGYSQPAPLWHSPGGPPTATGLQPNRPTYRPAQATSALQSTWKSYTLR
jgi:hypothetical protein